MLFRSCKGVSKHFGALAAVNNLSFEVAAGEVLGIGGPNGAGKTTLFEVISGLSRASRGSVVFEGRDITALAPEAVCHAGIARTFQLNASFDSLSVRDNVRVAAYFGRDNRRTPGLVLGADTEAHADAALAAVGLTGPTGRSPANCRCSTASSSCWPAPSPPGRGFFFSMSRWAASIPTRSTR